MEALERDINEMDTSDLRKLVLELAKKQPSLVFNLVGEVGEHPVEPPVGPDGQPDRDPPEGTPVGCVCNNCRAMPTLLETKCCGLAPDKCISRRPEMDIAILNRTVLGLSQAFYNDIMAERDDNDINRGFRNQAYRQFSVWTHGRLGRGVRRVHPACAVWRIRDNYPDARGIYTGYRPGTAGEGYEPRD